MDGVYIYETIWVIAIILFLVIEELTPGLISIWFAGGALGALITAVLGFGSCVQIITFILASAILIIALREVALKSFKTRAEKTDIDRILGKTVTITKVSDKNKCEATVMINDVEWKVRGEDELNEGDSVKIVSVEGVRLIVEK